MDAIFIGTAAALTVLLVFILGVAFGSRMAGGSRSHAGSVSPSEEEKLRQQEDQKAFESLLHYNIDVVYGRSTLEGDEV